MFKQDQKERQAKHEINPVFIGSAQNICFHHLTPFSKLVTFMVLNATDLGVHKMLDPYQITLFSELNLSYKMFFGK